MKIRTDEMIARVIAVVSAVVFFYSVSTSQEWQWVVFPFLALCYGIFCGWFNSTAKI